MSFFRRSAHLQHLNTLDGIRALSIIFVITFHAFFFSQYAFENHQQFLSFSNGLPWWLAWVRRGDLGVDIFFVLSAFLIGQQLFHEKASGKTISLKRFYLKRFFRIYPIYLFALLLFNVAKGWNVNTLGNIFAFNNLFNLRDIVIPWSWSLSVEIQFYAVFPIVLIAIKGVRSALFIGTALILISATWMSYFYLNSPHFINEGVMDFLLNNNKEAIIYYMQWLYVSPLARVPAFVFGVAAAWLWIHKQDLAQQHYQQHRKIYGAATAGIVLCCLAMASFNIYQPAADMGELEKTLYTFNMIAGRALFSLLVASLLFISLLPSSNQSMSQRFLAHKLLYPIARGSYAMYLFHPYLLFLAYFTLFGEGKITELTNGGLLSLAALGVLFSLIFSFISYHAIERWFSYSRFKSKLEKSTR